MVNLPIALLQGKIFVASHSAVIKATPRQGKQLGLMP